MYWTCFECGEAFDIPAYRKDRAGNKTPCCPVCNSRDIEEVDEDDPDDIVDYEYWEE